MTGPLDERGRPVAALPPESPPWMAASFADPPRLRRLDIAGAGIELLEWGPAAGPGVMLVHGQAAHADWWRFIAPILSDGGRRRVIVPSLSGMGGSDWRDRYDLAGYGREIAAIVHETGLSAEPGRSLLVAHSFGCLVALAAARTIGDALGGLALIDFYLPPPDATPRSGPPRKPRRYAGMADALARFRLTPEQDCGTPAMLDFVARRTVRHVAGPDGGWWTWCSDPRALSAHDHVATRANLAMVTRPLTILRGGRSRLMDRAVLAHVLAIAPAATRHVEIPDSDHHVPLDQPLALVAALNALMAADGL